VAKPSHEWPWDINVHFKLSVHIPSSSG